MEMHKVHIPGKAGLWEIRIEDGKIRSIRPDREACGREDWILPPLSDRHIHLGWTDFFHEVQEKRPREEVKERILESAVFLKKIGFSRIRDASGLSEEDRALCEVEGGKDFYLEKGWVKIFATGGVGVSPQSVLTPLMSEEAFAEQVRQLKAAKKKIMVHTYGGRTLDWCIRYGVDSVEHGVYMTEAQAEGLARRGILYVPTVCIYRMLAQEKGFFEIPDFLRENAKAAAYAHPNAVKYALESGVRLGIGTDFYADPALLRHEPEEMLALMGCGLTEERLLEVLLETDGGTVRLEEGQEADFLVFTEDPMQVKNLSQWEASLLGTGRQLSEKSS